ncbi:hypothetical protein [Herbiconiux daphne]|uniref:DUF202 domain-containing protein n=1 Tax=Herbiconiux daphne TaxID=2970914 RepID=A0ABT2GZJ7_9MICO|nr:hypothetical protein [Herbiconiux daphne]MCS5733389.1 hypothetical protein [Herbiconiux daphne]
MPDDTPKPPTAVWRWPVEWVREEKFWRDIGTRVLAGVITAAVVYLGALLLGYLHTPEIGAGLTLALGIAGGGILVAIAVGVLATIPARARSERPFAGRIVTALILVVLAIALVLSVVTELLRG